MLPRTAIQFKLDVASRCPRLRRWRQPTMLWGMKPPPDLLIVAGSENSADILYATRFFAPDPFVYFRRRGKTYLVASDLELDRARARAEVDRVLSQSSLQKQFPKAKKSLTLLALTFRRFHVRKVHHPSSWGQARRAIMFFCTLFIKMSRCGTL